MLHKRLPQLARALPPVELATQDGAAGTLSVELGVVDAGRDDALVSQRLYGVEQPRL